MRPWGQENNAPVHAQAHARSSFSYSWLMAHGSTYIDNVNVMLSAAHLFSRRLGAAVAIAVPSSSGGANRDAGSGSATAITGGLPTRAANAAVAARDAAVGCACVIVADLAWGAARIAVAVSGDLVAAVAVHIAGAREEACGSRSTASTSSAAGAFGLRVEPAAAARRGERGRALLPGGCPVVVQYSHW